MSKYDSFLNIAEKETPYLEQWYLDTPVVITTKRYTELKKVQQLLHKTIHHFAIHYDEYSHIFPLSGTLARIVDVCKPCPYSIGTYRPDFLIAADNGLKICEIGTRFPLNGFFMSGFAEYIGEKKFSHVFSSEIKKEFERFLNYLFEYWGTFSRLCVLKGRDKPCDIKYYIPYFEKLGIEVTLISPAEIENNLDKLTDAAVINEFNQMEIELFSTPALEKIAASNALNDLRSIYLIHDKRYLAVLSDKEFLNAALDKEESEFLQNYLIPTYTRSQTPEKWQEARIDKDKWMIKHQLLGKSEKVYAGCVTGQEEWRYLFESQEIEDMILQPYIKQKKIKSKIGDNPYDDFVVGTLLCFDNHFFGPGVFRASSFEITNRVDDRKMAPCITDYRFNTNNIFIL
jgi:hypothetical protein